MVQHSHCHCCGTAYDNEEWPRQCRQCGHQQWHNPTPIAVMLQTVRDGDRLGILTPVRGIEPRKGLPGLIGGYQEATDLSSEHAARREMMEEIGYEIPDYQPLELLCTRSTGPVMPGKRQNLIFMVNHEAIDISWCQDFEPNDETLALQVAWQPESLAFPSHSFALALYFLRYHGIHDKRYLVQPDITSDLVGPIINVPYDQPQLTSEGIWTVEGTDGLRAWKPAQIVKTIYSGKS